MPADAAAQPAAASPDIKPPLAVNPDRVGEELADDANIWHVYDRVAREDDDRRTKAWDTGLNNLALFAGLFSAVTTAFIIEAQQDMEPDYAQLTFLVLNATNFGERFVQEPFVVASSARAVNCLWVSSLILSLSAALIAIMGKDWIGMYTARPVCNLRQWAEMRAYRLRCVDQWYMSGVIAAAPVLLHVSLLLFGAGLVLFISSDPFTQRLTLGLSLAAGALYLVTTFSAVVFSTSPFKSPATQMIRAAISAVFSYLRSVVYRVNHNLFHTLPRNANTILAGGEDDTLTLPGNTPETRQLSVLLMPAAVVSAAGGSAIAYMRKLPTLLQSARDHLRWSCVRSQVVSVTSAVCRIPLSDWFFATTWTDIPADRRPHLIADALSWLSGASQAPDVFRAIVFALGDLEIGRNVGLHTAPALHTRLRAEIRRTCGKVDFITLCRYALADRNTPGSPVLYYYHFARRFDPSKDSALRCEDGLAAVVLSGGSPKDVAPYAPNTVSQPRLLELLLPYIKQEPAYRLGVLVLLSNIYREYLLSTSVPGNWEAHLYASLSARARKAYASEITVKYGGTAGPIELLTFLCCNDEIDGSIKPAAVELIMELLEYPIHRELRCLAYLFGSSRLLPFASPEWSLSDINIGILTISLGESLSHPFQPSSVRTPSHDREFDLALVRISLMALSGVYMQRVFRWRWTKFLSGYLCQTPPDDYEKRNSISLILERAALLGIIGRPDHFWYDDDIARLGTAILAVIIRDLGRGLRGPTTFDKGKFAALVRIQITRPDNNTRTKERLVALLRKLITRPNNDPRTKELFAALVLKQVTGPDGDTRTWDLGNWLRVHAPTIIEACPSSTTPMQDVHDALVALYPLCQADPDLRALWDRIGYPGRPGDIFSNPFLDVGAFFECAEEPPSPWMIWR